MAVAGARAAARPAFARPRADETHGRFGLSRRRAVPILRAPRAVAGGVSRPSRGESPTRDVADARLEELLAKVRTALGVSGPADAHEMMRAPDRQTYLEHQLQQKRSRLRRYERLFDLQCTVTEDEMELADIFYGRDPAARRPYTLPCARIYIRPIVCKATHGQAKHNDLCTCFTCM